MLRFLVEFSVVDEAGEVVYSDDVAVTIPLESRLTDREAFDAATDLIRRGIAPQGRTHIERKEAESRKRVSSTEGLVVMGRAVLRCPKHPETEHQPWASFCTTCSTPLEVIAVQTK